MTTETEEQILDWIEEVNLLIELEQSTTNDPIELKWMNLEIELHQEKLINLEKKYITNARVKN
jgi:hypothetical protein|tara:strand:- start:174 stop:362 length:189 start_codon:yes stop_codon:yes gene_type:complete